MFKDQNLYREETNTFVFMMMNKCGCTNTGASFCGRMMSMKYFLSTKHRFDDFEIRKTGSRIISTSNSVKTGPFLIIDDGINAAGTTIFWRTKIEIGLRCNIKKHDRVDFQIGIGREDDIHCE